MHAVKGAILYGQCRRHDDQGKPSTPLSNVEVAYSQVFILCMLLSAHGAGVIIVSDGNQTRPYCSWGGDDAFPVCPAPWDPTVRQQCAEGLCQASGYQSGTWVSDTGDFCEETDGTNFRRELPLARLALFEWHAASNA